MSEPVPVASLSPAEAAVWLNIDEATVQSLIRAEFLRTDDNAMIALGEVKSFSARNSQLVGSQHELYQEGDFLALVQALDQQIDDLANRAQAMFAKVVPETRQWSDLQRSEFVAQARGRFSAVLAVVSQGAQVDGALRRDLEEVGASAAWAGSSLPHLQLVLRISRDLLMQTAMQMAQREDGRLQASIEGFLARLFPAIDNLLDAIAHGYWDALLGRLRTVQERLGSLFEKIPYPMYEVDIDGLIRHANLAFATLFESEPDVLIGKPLTDVVHPIDGSVGALLAEPAGDVSVVRLTLGPHETPLTVDVDTVVHRIDGVIEGFAGLLRPPSPEPTPTR